MKSRFYILPILFKALGRNCSYLCLHSLLLISSELLIRAFASEMESETKKQTATASESTKMNFFLCVLLQATMFSSILPLDAIRYL